MKDMLDNLLHSRKAWVMLISVVGVLVLAALGKVTADQALGFLKWVIPTWFAAVALEDAAQKHGEAVASAASVFAPPEPQTTVVNTSVRMDGEKVASAVERAADTLRPPQTGDAP